MLSAGGGQESWPLLTRNWQRGNITELGTVWNILEPWPQLVPNSSMDLLGKPFISLATGPCLEPRSVGPEHSRAAGMQTMRNPSVVPCRLGMVPSHLSLATGSCVQGVWQAAWAWETEVFHTLAGSKDGLQRDHPSESNKSTILRVPFQCSQFSRQKASREGFSNVGAQKIDCFQLKMIAIGWFVSTPSLRNHQI